MVRQIPDYSGNGQPQMITATVKLISNDSLAANDAVRCDDIYLLVTAVKVDEQEYLIVNAHYPPVDRVICKAIQARLHKAHPKAIIGIHTEDSEGSATVLTGIGHDSHYVGIASAVAVIKTGWGWDRSDSILIRINGIEVRVHTHFNGQDWIADSEVQQAIRVINN
jgi:hypothetical protein